jgi:hypothetical protein
VHGTRARCASSSVVAESCAYAAGNSRGARCRISVVPGAVADRSRGIRPNLLSHRTTSTGRDRCRLHTPARGTRAGSPQLSDAAGRKSRIPLHHHQARVPSPPASSVPLPSTCWVWVRATHAGAHTAVRPPLTRAAGAGLNSPGSISLNDSRHTSPVAYDPYVAGRPVSTCRLTVNVCRAVGSVVRITRENGPRNRISGPRTAAALSQVHAAAHQDLAVHLTSTFDLSAAVGTMALCTLSIAPRYS